MTTPDAYNFKELFHFALPYTRKRYWGTLIIALVTNLVLMFVLGIISAMLPPVAIVSIVAGFAIFWVMLATVIKRLRDANLNLWWSLISFVPVVNFVAFIVFGCLGSAEPKNDQRAKAVVITNLLLAAALMILPSVIIAALGLSMLNEASISQMEAQNAEMRVMEAEQSLAVSGTEPAPVAEPVAAPEAQPAVEVPVEQPRGE